MIVRTLLLALVFGAAAGAWVYLPSVFAVSYSVPTTGALPLATSTVPGYKAEVGMHIKRPDPLKAIYMSQCVSGTPGFRQELVDLVDSTELNAIVIDIRDFTGKISFPTDNPKLSGMVSDKCGARDMRSFIKTLHEKDIFVIGRITVFQNPYWSELHPEHAVQHINGGVWHDRKGLAFVDVGAKPYWESVVELAKESYAIGFDEINFDYIRYPSDGVMADAVYSWSEGVSKQRKLEEFYQYLHENLKDTGMVLSADLFGYTMVNNDDLGIGQLLERALPYFDYIYPMVYPSHFNDGFAGLDSPNDDVYQVIAHSMGPGIMRALATTTRHASLVYDAIASTSPQLYKKPMYKGKVVPWLQDFDYPVEYTPEMVQAQIKASQDAGTDSYLFWDAGNKYSSLRQILNSHTAVSQ